MVWTQELELRGGKQAAGPRASGTESAPSATAFATGRDIQLSWEKLLPDQIRRPYRHAKLVLFRDVSGEAESATGPFYCPADEKVYLDLGFFDELEQESGAPGEFGKPT